MILKDLVDKLLYDSSKPFIFFINSKTYTYYEVVSSKDLLNIYINKLEIDGRLSELNDNDIVKVVKTNNVEEDDIDLILPYNSHYYLIIVKIN